MNLAPLPWQKRALDRILYACFTLNHDHQYLHAPPGVGKTAAIALVGEASPIKGTRVIVVGKAKLVKQHRESFVQKFGWSPRDAKVRDNETAFFKSPKGDTWIITTWQSAARSPHRFIDADEPVAILFFDECHVGGSNDENVSFKNINGSLKPAKCIYVSATTQTVSEKLLGIRAGHSFVLSMSDAYKEDLLNPVDMVEVHTGLRAEITKVEKATSRSFDQLQEMTDVEFEKIAQADDLNELATDLSRRKVNVVAARDKIIAHKYKSMIALYFANHLGDPAIFFCPNIDAANRAADWFNTKAMRARKMNFRAFAVHTDNPEHEARITDFEEGRCPILFVVGMLQEGFDMKPLALAFDCRFYREWDKAKVARLLQKVGRLTRKLAGKPTSTYYFARDIFDYLRQPKPGVRKPADVPKLDGIDREALADQAQQSVAEMMSMADGLIDDETPTWKQPDVAVAPAVVTDQLLSDDAPAAVTEPGVDDAVAGGADVDMPFAGNKPTIATSRPTQSAEDRVATPFETVKITMAKVPLYRFEVKDIKDFREVRRYKSADLFGTSLDQRVAALLQLAEGVIIAAGREGV